MAGYIGSIPVPQATQTREAFTATSNQTTFNTGGYTAGFIDVYMNGVKLAAADFTATNGSDVVLASGAAANDIVEVVAYTAFEVLNQNFTGTTTVEALTATGAISGTSADFDGGVTIDNITIDGAEIDLSAGDLLLDVAGDIILDADGGDISFKDGGTEIGRFINDSSSLQIRSTVNNKDIVFAGRDDNSTINALTLDMSDAGTAIFNNNVGIGVTPFAKLNVYGSNNSNVMVVDAQGTAPNYIFDVRDDGTSKFRVDGSGRVGIGVTPAYKLEIVESANAFAARITNNSDGSQGLQVRTSDNDTGQYILDLQSSSSATGTNYASKFVVEKGGNVGIGNNSPNYTLSVEKDVDTWISRIYNTGSDANASGLLVRTDATAAHNANAFAVYADSSYKLMIKSDGNIGVNTTTPVDFGDNFKNLNLNGVKGGALSFTRGTNSATRQWDIYTSDADQLIFYKGGSTDAMVLNAAGHLGLGTNSPTDNAWGHSTHGNMEMTINGGGGYAVLHMTGDGASSSSKTFSQGVGDSQFYMAYDKNNAAHRIVVSSSGDVMFNTQNTAIATSNSQFGAVISSGGRIFSSVNNDHHDLNRASGNGELIRCRRGGTAVGSISVTTSATSFNTSSDYRLKTDAKPITGATDRIKQLNPVNFKWIVDDTRADGFIAHEAEAVVPEAITGAKDAVDADGNPVYQGIDQSKLVPLLVATIKELEARITTLEAN